MWSFIRNMRTCEIYTAMRATDRNLTISLCSYIPETLCAKTLRIFLWLLMADQCQSSIHWNMTCVVYKWATILNVHDFIITKGISNRHTNWRPLWDYSPLLFPLTRSNQTTRQLSCRHDTSESIWWPGATAAWNLFNRFPTATSRMLSKTLWFSYR